MNRSIGAWLTNKNINSEGDFGNYLFFTFEIPQGMSNCEIFYKLKAVYDDFVKWVMVFTNNNDIKIPFATKFFIMLIYKVFCDNEAILFKHTNNLDDFILKAKNRACRLSLESCYSSILESEDKSAERLENFIDQSKTPSVYSFDEDPLGGYEESSLFMPMNNNFDDESSNIVIQELDVSQ